ncbi:MAG: hypothetical protein EOO92_15355 [Pedobacter sp.]|nr:MAG: hypothetical protein EOO92_15355 [Pedobacter sp.]
MKKTISLLAFLILLVTAVSAQTSWVSQKIDDRFTLKFPVTPKLEKAIYIAKGPDSTGYTLNIVDFNVVAKLDSAALAPIKDTEEFASQLKSGLIQSLPMLANSEIAIGKFKGYTSYTISGGNDEKKAKLYIQMILVGSKLYSMASAVQDATGEAGLKNKDVFFASPVIK